MCFSGAVVIMNTCKKEIFDIYFAFIFFFSFMLARFLCFKDIKKIRGTNFTINHID